MASGYIASGETMGSPRSAHITMGTHEYPNGTVTISGTWRNRQALACYYDVDICDSAGNNATNIGRFQINGASSYGPNDENKTVSKSVSNLTGLKGKAIYVKLRGVGSGPDASQIEPKGNVSVSIATTTPSYSVTVQNDGHGSLSASSYSATPGTIITLTATPNTGYQFSSYTKTNVSFTDSTHKFTMPEKNVTVKANFSLRTYTITTSAGTGGSLSANKSSATMGTSVTLTPRANTGYSFSSYTKSPASLSISNNSFTMPASNVSITANFIKISYSVTGISNPAGAGTVTLSKSTANYGDTITLTATPDTGFRFVSWSTNVSGVTISNNSFVMPASNITITANFESSGSYISEPVSTQRYLVGGNEFSFHINKFTSIYSHKCQLSFGSFETDILTINDNVTDYTIDIPSTWSNLVTDSEMLDNGVLTLWSYDNDELIGSRSITGLIFVVPQTIKPTLSSITTSVARTIDGTTYANIGNYYVQNHCGVRVQATGSGSNGSAIVGYKVYIEGYPENDIYISGSSLDWTSGLLANNGATNIYVTAIDSRGREVQNSASISVQSYSPPSGTFNVWRVDDDGTATEDGPKARYILSKAYTQIGSNSLSWRIISDASYASNPSNTGFVLPGNVLMYNDEEHYISLELEDAFETTMINALLQNAGYLLKPNNT